MKKKVFVIAEAGVNHNGCLQNAYKLIDVAAQAKADAVKFQTFKADTLVTQDADKASYQKRNSLNDESQYEMLKKLELSNEDHQKLINYCKQKGIQFLSSAFDCDGIEFLHGLGLEIFKIPSGEITNLPYLRYVGKLKKKVILSTGMSTLQEVESALNILIESGTKKDHITILHCNTEYPTPLEDVNLLAMKTMQDVFKVNVGYSDHTCGSMVSLAAVALGATVIEKHFTLDPSMQGPDHAASLGPLELVDLVKSVRDIELVLGDGVKIPSKSEIKNIEIARKSIVAKTAIMANEILSEKNITVKRPGGGMNPMKWDEVLGTRARRNFQKDEFIE